MTTVSNYDKRRRYAGEPYLRAEHLLHNGRYAAVTVEIADVVYDCPKKRMGKDPGQQQQEERGMGKMIGLALKNSNKVLGLNATNESLVSLCTGEGSASGWVGKKIQLVVRLIEDKRKKVWEPAIRVWPPPGMHPPNNRIREQMGEPVTETWYEANPIGTTEPQAEPVVDQATRDSLIERWKALAANVKTTDDAAECRNKMAQLVAYLEKYRRPLTADEQRDLTGLLDAATPVAE